MRFNIRTRILSIFIAILLSFGIIVYFYTDIKISALAEELILEKLDADLKLGQSLLDEKYNGDWSVKGDQLYKGDTLINGNFAFVDEIKAQTGSYATLFCGDTRVSTNVPGGNSGRATGTKASDKVIDAVLKNGKPYKGEAKVAGKDCIVQYVPLQDSSGKIIGMWFVGVEKSHATGQIGSVLKTIGVVSGAAGVIGIVIFILLTGVIIRNVRKIVSALGEVATGNLLVKVDVKSSDEIGDIAQNSNKMIDAIRVLIGNTKDTSITMKESSSTMQEALNEVGQVSEQIAVAISELAKGATEQASSTDQGNSHIQSIVSGLKLVSAGVNEVKLLVQRAKVTLEAGDKTVEHQQHQMEESRHTAVNVNKAVTMLSSKSEEIGQILGVIRGIAEQTNLLALNAAIEAARAGEQGKGFAVVADEIRQLAEQSKGSVIKIGELIKDVQAGVGEATSEIGKVGIAVSAQEEALSDTVAAFASISDVFTAIMEKIGGVAQASEALGMDAERIGSEIAAIASVSEEAAAGTEEVAASTEEQTAVIQHLLNSVNSLSDMANKLNDNAMKFKV